MHRSKVRFENNQSQFSNNRRYVYVYDLQESDLNNRVRFEKTSVLMISEGIFKNDINFPQKMKRFIEFPNDFQMNFQKRFFYSVIFKKIPNLNKNTNFHLILLGKCFETFY